MWCKIINLKNTYIIAPHPISGHYGDYQIYYSTNFESFKQFKINA